MRWPPPRPISPSRVSRAIAAPRSTPGTERPEPLPSPPAKPITTAGRPKASLSRAATMPTTPGCQPSAAAQTSGPSAPRARTCASAAARTPASMSRRSAFSRSSRSARAAASCGSSVASSRAPRSAAPIRPPALTRGPSAKPSDQALGAPLTPATAASAARPGRAPPAITASPWRTSARLSPTSGATSATVASATRSSMASRSGPASPRRRSSRLTATSIRNTTPAAQR